MAISGPDSVRRIMSRPAVSVGEDTDLATAAETMLEHGVGSVLVVDGEGRVTGIVTDSDFCARDVRIPFSTFRLPQVLGHWLGKDGLERTYREARKRRVTEIMTRPVHAVEEGDPVERVLELMLRRDIKHVPVLRDGKPVGMVARYDLLKLLAEEVGVRGEGERR